MSIRYELAEFYDTALDRSGDFGFQVADTARRGLCSLWQNLPGALIPNPGDSFRRGALSALCQDFPPPPPPSAPFTGGQCACASYRVTFSRTVPGGQPQQVQAQAVSGPITGLERQDGGGVTTYSIRHGVCTGGVQTGTTLTLVSSSAVGTQASIVSIARVGGGLDNCGNPPDEFPGGDIINEGDTIFEGDTIVEGDRTIPITVDFSPTFEEDVCIGAFAFCADVEGNRVTLDLGGVTVNLPGTGGGDGGGGGSGDSETINNIDNRTTIIQNQQEDCCAAIIQSISSFRNRATELFNEAELRDACIVGLIRNATETVPSLVDSAATRASGSTGVLGSVRYVQPSRGDSCFLRIEITPTNSFKGKRYKILDDGELVEGSFGHAEVVFLDGTTVPHSEAGIRNLTNRRTFIWFPYVSSGNAIRLSLAGGLDYTVVDPGFRWVPKDLPTCEEVVDPGT